MCEGKYQCVSGRIIVKCGGIQTRKKQIIPRGENAHAVVHSLHTGIEVPWLFFVTEEGRELRRAYFMQSKASAVHILGTGN